MFRVKICGVRLEIDIRAVEASGADAIGLNFFPPSIRFVDPELASTAELAKAAHEAGLKAIGVFVNEPIETMQRVAKRFELDGIQLHGDEQIEVARSLIHTGHHVIRAVKLPRTPFTPDEVRSWADSWMDAGCHLLLDADAGSEHGGSGKTLDWNSVANWAKSTQASWTLAGGLTPENVGQAIETSHAISVDTASGVESSRGVKDPARIQRFLDAAKASLGRRK